MDDRAALGIILSPPRTQPYHLDGNMKLKLWSLHARLNHEVTALYFQRFFFSQSTELHRVCKVDGESRGGWTCAAQATPIRLGHLPLGYNGYGPAYPVNQGFACGEAVMRCILP